MVQPQFANEVAFEREITVLTTVDFIRLPLLIDIQAWLAAQGARPEYVAI